MSSGLFSLSDTEDVLWEKLHKFAGDNFGVTSALYGFCHNRSTVARTGITNALVIKSSHPQEYHDRFPDGEFLETDSSSMQLLTSTAPILWSVSEDWDGCTPAQLERAKIDEEFGMDTGVSMGFEFSDGQGVSGIGLSARYMKAEDFEKIWRKSSAAILEMVHAFEPLMRQRMIENRFKLTAREIDVLTFSAGGLSAKGIARHLNIAPKTVFNTLNRARERMQAASTAEAVAKAYVFRLI